MAPGYRPNSYTGSIIAIFCNLRLHLNGSTLAKSNTMQHTHDLRGNITNQCARIYTNRVNLRFGLKRRLKMYKVRQERGLLTLIDEHERCEKLNSDGLSLMFVKIAPIPKYVGTA